MNKSRWKYKTLKEDTFDMKGQDIAADKDTSCRKQTAPKSHAAQILWMRYTQTLPATILENNKNNFKKWSNERSHKIIAQMLSESAHKFEAQRIQVAVSVIDT